jgi:endo-1,4-beta-xylanase
VVFFVSRSNKKSLNMEKTHRRTCPLTAAHCLLVGILAGCASSGADGAGGNNTNSFGAQPTANERSDESETPATPGEASAGTPGASIAEGPAGEVVLQPTEEPVPGATGEPEAMVPEAMVPEAEVPVVQVPLPKFVGNITTGNSVDTNGFIFSDHWDQITPENAGKWGSVQNNAQSARNWAALDAIYDYTEQKGIIFKEHTFVWGAQQPTGNLTQADVQSWMQEFCTRYPNTRLIDVVNEPPPHTEPSYADAIGGGTDGDWQWISNAFTWAREACPNAILILNDYNNIEIGNQNQHFIDIARAVQASGAPIDALGAQAHGLNGANSAANMISLLTKMHDDTGLPVYITEYDINQNDDAAQLARFQEHFSFFLDTEWVRGMTIWGWIFGRTWVASSGLIRDTAPRPAMVWLMGELGRPVP